MKRFTFNALTGTVATVTPIEYEPDLAADDRDHPHINLVRSYCTKE